MVTRPTPALPLPTIGIIGGSGLYEIDGLKNVCSVEVSTPFGAPSAPIVCGQIDSVTYCFLPRHGRHHQISPSEINYRANIYALKSLGVSWCVSVSAVGSLDEELRPGDLVVPDQIIDRTTKRTSSFFSDGIVAHVGFADPYCPELTSVVAAAAEATTAGAANTLPCRVHRGGTYLCMEGPLFSTRAESHLYRSWGAKIIGMTAIPEARLAREAEIAYATLALVTDYDCWKADGHDVDVAAIQTIIKQNTTRARQIIAQLGDRLRTAPPSKLASSALDNAIITPRDHVPAEAGARLEALLARVWSTPG